jgi:hypothetical protein
MRALVPRRLATVVAAAATMTALVATVTACSGGDDGAPGGEPAVTTGIPASTGAATVTAPGTTSDPGRSDATAPASADADAATVAAITAALDAAPAGCDPLDTRQCLLPFPSDAYTVADPTSATGVRVAIPADGTPGNVDGVPVEVTEWNRNDGFSPNSTILTHVRDLDTEASALPPWTDLDASLAADANVVLVDVATGERVPLWAEPTTDAPTADDSLLVVQPAVSLEESTTYAVGLRGLVTTAGAPVEPTPAFRAYRDALATDLPEIERRRDAMEAAFNALEAAGVARDDLQLAWTFTTASTENLTGRMLHIRDETLAALGGSAPPFTVTDVVEPGEEGIARQVVGTFTVTNWLTGDGSPGNRFHYGGSTGAPGALDDLPVANGTLQAPFVCNIGDAVAVGRQPGRLVQYGHGLLGSHFEIDARNVRDMSNEHNAVHCATKWAGMSEDDIPNAVAALGDLSLFPSMADRLQQGVLDQLVLGRLMLASDGLVTHPAFQRPDATPLIDTSELVFDGNSQGGIMGMMLTAVSTDIERAVLGVPGMNYSMLLPRSVDFDIYEAVFEPAYPNPLDRTLLISLVQMLWDRGEGGGYAHHITSDPLPGTEAKDVLLQVALGDHQVTELAAYVAARTMEIPIHRPVTAPGRSRETEPGWGLDTLVYPGSGSAIVVWDSGAETIPLERDAPRAGQDPHEDPRADEVVRLQKGAFLFGDLIIDVCGPDLPCTEPPRD